MFLSISISRQYIYIYCVFLILSHILSYYAQFGGEGADREAPNQRVPSNYAMQSSKSLPIELPLERAFLLAGCFCLGRNFQKLLLILAVVFLPLHIDTNHNDVVVMLILCNGQCPQLIRKYYFRGLCAVTEGASAKNPGFFLGERSNIYLQSLASGDDP
jgi:hypothetical protein